MFQAARKDFEGFQGGCRRGSWQDASRVFPAVVLKVRASDLALVDGLYLTGFGNSERIYDIAVDGAALYVGGEASTGYAGGGQTEANLWKYHRETFALEWAVKLGAPPFTVQAADGKVWAVHENQPTNSRPAISSYTAAGVFRFKHIEVTGLTDPRGTPKFLKAGLGLPNVRSAIVVNAAGTHLYGMYDVNPDTEVYKAAESSLAAAWNRFTPLVVEQPASLLATGSYLYWQQSPGVLIINEASGTDVGTITLSNVVDFVHDGTYLVVMTTTHLYRYTSTGTLVDSVQVQSTPTDHDRITAALGTDGTNYYVVGVATDEWTGASADEFANVLRFDGTLARTHAANYFDRNQLNVSDYYPRRIRVADGHVYIALSRTSRGAYQP